jgi:tetratricopeptide (TPR) repeat protein
MSESTQTLVFPGSRAWWVLAAGLLTAFLALSLMMLRPRFISQQGVRLFKTGSHDRAAAVFQQARAAIPDFLSRSRLTAADRFRLDFWHGRALYRSGSAAWQDGRPTFQVYDRFLQSRQYLEQAAAVEPGDYLTAFSRARTEHALERIHPWLFPDTPTPFNADDLYRQATALRPAGITVRQAHARYLYETGQVDRIPGPVQDLLAVYPPAFDTLKKEPYYTPGLLPHMARGLEQAVHNRVRPRDALKRLSVLYREQGDPAGAIDTFEAYLAWEPGANTFGDYFGLGTLCLADGRPAQARDAFLRSLTAARDREAALNRIYRHFKAKKQLTRFLSFVSHLEGSAPPVPGIDMAKARTYLDLDQSFLAEQTLMQIMATRPTAPAADLLARIAQKDKDWDTMERFLRQATRLDPHNPGYHYRFAQVLNNRKNYADAEYAVTRAMRYAPRESAGYYNFRAWTRWHQEKYTAAARDWDRAAALNPENPDYPERAAQARNK